MPLHPTDRRATKYTEGFLWAASAEWGHLETPFVP